MPSPQNMIILGRLQCGPATNRELAGLALNYRARISDLRVLGFDIREDKGWYKLIE